MALAHGVVRAVTYLHAEPIVYTLRLYYEPDGYARRLPYLAVATVSLLGARAWISGMHGQFDRAGWRAINDWLWSRGVRSAEMERRGRIVSVPVACNPGAGEPIRSEARW